MTGNKNQPGCLLIDLDGVIYQADRLIEGASATLEWLELQRVPHLYVTNTTSRSRAALLEKLRAFGFKVKPEALMTPIIAAKQWLSERRYKRIAAFVPSAALEDFSGLDIVKDEQEFSVDAVVVGDLGQDWSYQRLNRAFRLLMQEPRPALIALGMTRYWRGKDGLLLDVAPFVKALEHAADCQAVVVGKPASAFFDASLRLLDCGLSQAFMIGDDIVGDVGAAQVCGIRGIQVRTGKFRESDLDGEIRPFAVLDSIADLPQWWESRESDSG